MNTNLKRGFAAVATIAVGVAAGVILMGASGGNAAPRKMADMWLVHSDFGEDGPLPPLDEAQTLSADGNIVGFFGTHNFGAVGTNPRLQTNAVGGVGRWRWTGDGEIETSFFRYMFIPVQPLGALYPNKEIGFVRGKFTGAFVSADRVEGRVYFESVSTDAGVCQGYGFASAPCVLRSGWGDCSMDRITDVFALAPAVAVPPDPGN